MDISEFCSTVYYHLTNNSMMQYEIFAEDLDDNPFHFSDAHTFGVYRHEDGKEWALSREQVVEIFDLLGLSLNKKYTKLYIYRFVQTVSTDDSIIIRLTINANYSRGIFYILDWHDKDLMNAHAIIDPEKFVRQDD